MRTTTAGHVLYVARWGEGERGRERERERERGREGEKEAERGGIERRQNSAHVLDSHSSLQ